MEFRLKKDLLLGVATAATQIEGGDVDLCERENAGCGRKCGSLCCKKMQ